MMNKKLYSFVMVGITAMLVLGFVYYWKPGMSNVTQEIVTNVDDRYEPCDGPFDDSFVVSGVSTPTILVDNCGIPTIYEIKENKEKVVIFRGKRPQYHISRGYLSPSGNYLNFTFGHQESDAVNMLLDIVRGKIIETEPEWMWGKKSWADDDSFLVVIDFDQAWGHDNLYVILLNGEISVVPVFITKQGVPTPDREILQQVDSGSVVISDNTIFFAVRKFLDGEWLEPDAYIYNVIENNLKNAGE